MNDSFIVLKQKSYATWWSVLFKVTGEIQFWLVGLSRMIIKSLEEAPLVTVIHQIIQHNLMTLSKAFSIPSGRVKTI